MTVASRIVELAQRHRMERGLVGPPLAANRLHVTLMSFGTGVGPVPGRVTRVARAIGDAVRFSSFEISFDRAASFARSHRNRPYVLLGDDGVIDAKMLHKKLAGAALRYSSDERVFQRFTPHATLLYDDLQLSEQKIEPISWAVEEFVLIESWVGQTKHIVRGCWFSSQCLLAGELPHDAGLRAG